MNVMEVVVSVGSIVVILVISLFRRTTPDSREAGDVIMSPVPKGLD